MVLLLLELGDAVGEGETEGHFTPAGKKDLMGIFHVKLALQCVWVSYQSNCNHVHYIPAGVTNTLLVLSPITHVFTPTSAQENQFLMRG